MRFSGSRGAAFVFLAILSPHATIVAQETGAAPTAPLNPAQGTASARVPSAAGDPGSTKKEDWAAFAQTLLMFGPDSMVGEATLFDIKSGTSLRSLRRYGDNLRHVRFSPDSKLALKNSPVNGTSATVSRLMSDS